MTPDPMQARNAATDLESGHIDRQLATLLYVGDQLGRIADALEKANLAPSGRRTTPHNYGDPYCAVRMFSHPTVPGARCPVCRPAPAR